MVGEAVKLLDAHGPFLNRTQVGGMLLLDAATISQYVERYPDFPRPLDQTVSRQMLWPKRDRARILALDEGRSAGAREAREHPEQRLNEQRQRLIERLAQVVEEQARVRSELEGLGVQVPRPAKAAKRKG